MNVWHGMPPGVEHVVWVFAGKWNQDRAGAQAPACLRQSALAKAPPFLVSGRMSSSLLVSVSTCSFFGGAHGFVGCACAESKEKAEHVSVKEERDGGLSPISPTATPCSANQATKVAWHQVE